MSLLSYRIQILFYFIIIFGYKTVVCEDYCVFETFSPKCQQDEVVIMTSAMYGKMEVGKCIESDRGSLGCHGKVLYILDQMCSGKRACDVSVASQDMMSRSSCPNDVMQYLSASYICKKAMTLTSADCRRGVELSQRQILIHSNELQACIGHNIPMTFSAKLGQKINISLIDMHDPDDNLNINKIYGKIKDDKTKLEKNFGTGERNQHLIVTSGHSVTFVLASEEEHFALEFNVFGCIDMPPPEGAWMTRDGNIMEVGCHSGKHIWRLKCENDHWVGAVGSCGTVINDMESSPSEEVNPEEVSTNIIVFGACSVILLASSIVFLIGVLLLKSHNKMKYGNYAYQSGSPVLVPVTDKSIGFQSIPQQFTQTSNTSVDDWMTESQNYKSLQAN